MNFKRSIVNTSILSATLLASVSAMASTAFSSLPGTRANAMGGAYIAIANDTSSMFYNPAGIALIDGAEVMVEFGDIIRQDTSTLGSFYATHTGQPVIEEQELKFIGGVTNVEVFGADINIGLSYAPSLYTMPSQIFESFGNFDNAIESIKFETEVEQLGIGLGTNLGDLAIGVTIDYQNYVSRIVYSDVGRLSESGPCEAVEVCPNENDVLSEFSGIGYTAGFLYRNDFGEDDLSSFSFGAVYRNYDDAAETRDLETPDFNSLQLNFTSPVAPTSFGVGAAIEFPMGKAFQLLLSAQYEKQDFGLVVDDYIGTDGTNDVLERESVWERSSVGTELSWLADNGWQWFVRGGYYISEDADYADTRQEYSDISSVTGGVGVFIPGFGSLESTIEKRSIDNNGPAKAFDSFGETTGIGTYDVTLISVSYSYAWF